MEKDLNSHIREMFGMKEVDVRLYSPLSLAYIGDAVYDLIIRTLVVGQGNTSPSKLHKKTSSVVKAPSQAKTLFAIEDLLTEEEEKIVKRGRNAKSYTGAKNASVTEYRLATGFEALIGYLYLTDRFDRIVELVRAGLEEIKDEL
ncbi:MAG: ribonuclease III [Eubacterium sp.]|nr:ribonuclease III [Eubacterium sp.]